MKALAAASSVVAVLWAGLYFVPAPIPPETAWYDTTIVYEIAIVFSTAAVVMVISRKMWTLRAIGLLFSALALGILFWNAVYTRQSGYKVENGKVVANTNHGVQEAASDLARALLIVGGPLLMIGLIWWLIGRFGPRSDDLLDLHDPVVIEERRQMVRRDEDKKMREENRKYRERYGEWHSTR